MGEVERKNVLIIKNSNFLSMEDINIRKYKLFSGVLDGIILQRVINKTLTDATAGRFRFSCVYMNRFFQTRKVLGHLYFFAFVIYQSLRWKRRLRRIDYVITYDPFSSGLVGWVIAKLIGAGLVVEVNGNYGEKKTWGADRGSLVGMLKYHYCQYVVPFIANRSFGVKLLYPTQLDAFKRPIRNNNVQVFHEFVPVGDLEPSGKNEDYILFLGRPWYGKGVDLLIKAYNQICTSHTGCLRIVGHFPSPGLEYLHELRAGNDKIVIEPAVYYDKAQDLIDRCDFLVLPSRTEAMGRVLLEAMAHKKAVVGSTADGIPTYVKDSYNGLLFESGNWQSLARVLEKLVKDDALKSRLAEKGFREVHQNLSEEAYLRRYISLLGLPETGTHPDVPS